jgi:hypothetical protein
MEELIKIHSPEFNDIEIKYIKDMINKDLKKTKPIFNLKGFLFGWFYLLYKRAYMEALAVIIISLLFMQIGFILHSFLFLGLGLIMPNILVGWFFYFMYSNKIDRDIEECGKPVDKECLANKGKKSPAMVALAVFIVAFLSWPVIYGSITKQDITTEQNKYINKVQKALK